MSHIALVAYYCLFVLLASIAGGMIPIWFRLTHRGMQLAVSFVSGVMLGVAVLLMLPHAVDGALANNGASPTFDAVAATMGWLLAGILTMFFIERFLCYHHHDVPDDAGDSEPHDGHSCGDHSHRHDHDHHVHDVTWSGAALGMTLHSILDGVALAASVEHGSDGRWLAGFGTFLVILLHKPFDSLTISMLMARGRRNSPLRHLVNALFSLSIPVGVLIFYFGLLRGEGGDSASTGLIVSYALAFSAGTFLCISCSDLLPELQFHQHDRVKLSAALVLGLALAAVIARLEAATHAGHYHGLPPAVTER